MAVLCLGGSAWAATHTWTGAGADDNWSTSANWRGGSPPVPGNFTADLQFNLPAGGTTNAQAQYKVDSIIFAAGAGAFTVNGNAVNGIRVDDEIVNNSTTTQTFQGGVLMRPQGGTPAVIDAAAGDIVFDNTANRELRMYAQPVVFTGANDIFVHREIRVDSGAQQGVTKNGSGTTTFSGTGGNNAYTGLTTVNDGTLAVGGGFGGDGAIRGNVTINNGGTFELLQSNIIINDSLFTVNTGGTFDRNGFSDVIGGIAGGGNVIGGGTLTLEYRSGTAATFSGNLTGGNLTIRGRNQNGTAAKQTLTGTATGLGTIAVERGNSANDNNILELAGGGSTTANSTNIGRAGSGTATLNIEDTHTLNTGNFFLGEANGHAGNANQSGGIVNANGQTRVGHWPNELSTYNLSAGTLNSTGGLYVGWDGNGDMNVTSAGNVSATGSMGTVIQRNSDLTIADNATFSTGIFRVGDDRGNGTLNLQDSATVSAGTVSVADAGSAPGVVNQSGGNFTVSNHVLVGHWPNNTSTYNMSGGSLNLTGTPTGGTEQHGGVYLGIDGTGILNHSDGTITTKFLWLDNRGATGGTDQYNMTGGKLVLTHAIGIGSSNPGSMQIDLGGGTIQANANTQLNAPATLTGTGGNVTFDTNGNTINIPGVLSGPGGLVKTGAGTMTLTADNTYTGATTISAGTLTFSTPSFNTYRGGTITIEGPATMNVVRTGGFNRYDFQHKTIQWDSTGGGVLSLGAGINFVLDTASSGTTTFRTNGGAQNSIVGPGNVNMGNAGHTVNFDIAPGTGASGLLVSTALGNGAGISKTGDGTMVLSGNSTYRGATTVSGGVLHVAGKIYDGANADRDILVNAGGVLSVEDLGWNGSLGTSYYGVPGSPRLRLDNGTIRITGASTTATRHFRIGAGGATVDVATGSFTLLQDLPKHPLASDGGNLTLTGAGAGTMDKVVPGAGGLIKDGTGTWTLTRANTYAGPTTVADGTLALTGGGSIANSPVITVAQDGTFDVSGVSGGWHLPAGQTLRGDGTVAGPFTADSGSTVGPGTSSGVLHTDTVFLDPTSVLAIELGGALPGSGYDQLDVTGEVHIDGATLDVMLGYAPEEITNFILVNNDGTDPIDGRFAGLDEGDLFRESHDGIGYTFQITYFGGTGNDIAVTTIPEPATISLLGLAAMGLARYVRRRRRR